MSDVPHLSRSLAHFVANTRYEHLPQTTVASTKRVLLDALGVSLAATTLGEGVDAFVDLARAQGGAQTCTVLGAKFKTSSAFAAWVNGALAHALDFEDAHDAALVHPNAATVPAVLAVAESIGAVDGRRILTAMAVGCDVVCRMGLALRVALDDYGWYPPPILGAFGATAATANLLSLDERQVLDAFSLTLCQATCSAEIKYSPHSVIRAVRDSFAAKTGVLSAELARRGVSGFDAPLEGKAGFFALFARGQFEPKAILDALGTRFEIDNISFKPWPTCRGTHVYIEAALELMGQHGIKLADVARVSATGSRLNKMLVEPLASKRAPQTAIDAKFSIPFAVATALRFGGVSLDHFGAAALRDPATLDLAERIEYRVDPEDSGAPVSMTRGSLTIQTHSGATLTKKLSEPLGHPRRPLDDTRLVDKFVSCASHYRYPLNTSAARHMAADVFALDSAADAAARILSHLQEIEEL